MSVLEVMTAIWMVCTAAFVTLIIYRSHLTRHEMNQVYLTDGGVENQTEFQGEVMARRMDRLRPLLQTATGAFALLTVLMVGTYVIQILPSVRL